MGLAPYGEPRYVDLIQENLISVKDDGSFQLDMSYFDYPTGLRMTSKKFISYLVVRLVGSETQLTQLEMDLAASVQKVTEDIVLKIAKEAARETKEQNLCLAGGVALNCVANGILSKEKIFDNIWIQPAAGDAGALNAALSVWHLLNNGERKISLAGDKMKGAFLGPDFSEKEILDDLDACGAIYKKLSETDLINKVVNGLVNKKAIGWMHGRMEFGPRSLGGRSIIADPRSPHAEAA